MPYDLSLFCPKCRRWNAPNVERCSHCNYDLQDLSQAGHVETLLIELFAREMGCQSSEISIPLTDRLADHDVDVAKLERLFDVRIVMEQFNMLQTVGELADYIRSRVGRRSQSPVVGRPCRRCGAVNPFDAIFCRGCGEEAKQQETGPCVVEATEFVVKDNDGQVRASFGICDDGTAAVFLFDAKGTRVAISAGLEGPCVALLDAQGAKATLLLADEGPSLNLSDADGKLGASMQLTGEGPIFLLAQGKDSNMFLRFVNGVPDFSIKSPKDKAPGPNGGT